MQYQVYDEEDKRVIAMIDTESSEQIVLAGYGIKAGESLSLYAEPKKVVLAESLT